MGTKVYLEGTEDEFKITYTDTTVSIGTGENNYRSESWKPLTSFELKNVNMKYANVGGYSPYTGAAIAGSNPISIASADAYQYQDTGSGETFFSNAVAIWADQSDRNAPVVTEVSELQRLVWFPQVSKTSQFGKEYYLIYTSDHGVYSHMRLLKKDLSDYVTGMYDTGIRPMWLSPRYPNKAINTPDTQTLSCWAVVVGYKSSTPNSESHWSRRTNDWSMAKTQDFINFPSFGTVPLPKNNGNYVQHAFVSSDGNYIGITDGQRRDNNTSDGLAVKMAIHTEKEMLFWLATFGYKFSYDGKLYKPIVEGGYVVGYTDDMTKQSEWDKWHGFGDHATPSRPAGGGGAGELPPLAPRDGSIVRGGSWLYLTESDLYNFRNISRVDPDWWNNLSLAQKALLGTKIADTVANYGKEAPVTLLAYSYDIHSVHGLSAGASQTIACPVDLWGGDLLDPVGVTAYVPTGATGASFSVGSRRINAGSITVTPRDPAGVTFLDFEPYTTLHAYIPFVGWTSISCSQCMNKAVSLQYFIDIYSGTGVAYILSGSTVVQQYECSLAAEEALEVNQYSVHTSAMRDFTVPATAALTGAITGNPMATAIGVAGVVGAVGASIGNAMSAYSNPSTVMAGSHNTDASIDSCPNQFTIVAYRPDIELPDDYAHRVGHACDKTGPLSSFSGFTVVENPDTSGAVCTDDERRELEAILRGGIII